jgi:tRNA pseudouridine13 synthase
MEKEEFTNRLSEQDVGIRMYFNNETSGFECVLKHRYSDFLVNEIDIHGNVVWLKTDKVYKEPEKVVIATEEDIDRVTDSVFTGVIESSEDIVKLKQLCYKFVNKEINNDDRIDIPFITDKDLRRRLHEGIRSNFEFLDSETIGDQEKRISIFVDKKKSTFNKRRRTNPEKKYLHFSMLKRNLDTVYAVNYLARSLHRSTKTVRFSGNKDKRGVTTQKISSFNTSIDELRKLTKMNFWDKRIEIENYEYSDEELALGYLKGNQFSVVFRFVNISDEELRKSIELLTENGFINYYGMQRFGVSVIPTHRVGELVIKKQWKEVIYSIIKSVQTRGAVESAGLSYDDWIKGDELVDVDKVVKNLPKYTIEYRILSYLKNNKSAYYNAFRSLNRQLQVLYPHAYQSYIWNSVVSERINKYGKKVLIGDIARKRDVVVDDIDPDAEFDENVDYEAVPDDKPEDNNIVQSLSDKGNNFLLT